MRRKYLILLLVPLIIALSGCGKKRHYVAPPPSPFAPFDLVATAVSSTQINLTWKETSENEIGFYVYRKDTNDFRKIAVLDSNTTLYSDSPLQSETTYSYKITSYTNDGESSPSNIASATTLTEVEILNYYMEKEYRERYEGEWHTYIKGYVKNNTNQILTIQIAGGFYSNDEIAIEYCLLNNVNPGRDTPFSIYHRGKTEIEYVKVWIEEYY